jgi:pimeloyl-ACP methyl ester carboxylesterase
VLDWGGPTADRGRHVPAIVLLTGAGNNAHVFDDFAPKLVARYHVYGITRRGFAPSSIATSGYLADSLADDVLTVLDSLGLTGANRPVLVGHSIAGEELSSIGSRHPERVAGLAYLEAGYPYAFYDPAQENAPYVIPDVERQLAVVFDRWAPISYAERAAMIRSLTDSTLPILQRDLRSWAKDLENAPNANVRPTGIRRDPVASALFAGAQRYTTIRGPVLAIYAAPRPLPPNAPSDSAARARMDSVALAGVLPQITAFQRGVPQARVVRLAHATHYVFRSNESDVLRELQAFIGALPQVSGTNSPALTRPPDTLSSRDDRWRADLRFLSEQLPARHVNMFRFTTPAAFAREVARLDSAIPQLSDFQIRLRFVRLTSMLRDEHTGAVVLPQPAVRLPFDVLWMDDGPYVVAASAPLHELLGARVVAIDEHGMSAIADTLRAYIPHESEIGFRRQAEHALVFPEVLHGLGYARDTSSVMLEVVRPNGLRTRVETRAVPLGDYTPAARPGGEPSYRQHPGEKYWFTLLSDGLLFIKYNQCRDGAAFRAMSDSIARTLDTARIAHVVVDLRDNGGGDDSVIQPLLTVLEAHASLVRTRRVFAIIGRSTASSGLSAAHALHDRASATLVGEAAGPNRFGNVRSFRLPYSGMLVTYATKEHQADSGPAPTLNPDVLIAPTPEAVVAGRDLALEWIYTRP